MACGACYPPALLDSVRTNANAIRGEELTPSPPAPQKMDASKKDGAQTQGERRVKSSAPLTPREREILTSMLKLSAISQDKRKSSNAIAKKAGYAQSEAKRSLAKLKVKSLVDAVRGIGCHGGYYLTPKGQKRREAPLARVPIRT